PRQRDHAPWRELADRAPQRRAPRRHLLDHAVAVLVLELPEHGGQLRDHLEACITHANERSLAGDAARPKHLGLSQTDVELGRAGRPSDGPHAHPELSSCSCRTISASSWSVNPASLRSSTFVRLPTCLKSSN